MRIECNQIRLIRQGLFTLALVINLISYGQIKGYVKDSLSGEPLAEAMVIGANMNGTTTDSNGYFKLDGTFPISVSLIGYQETKFESALPDGAYPIGIEASMLNTYIVSVTREESAIKYATGSLLAIKPDLIRKTNPTSMTETIERVVGVVVVDQQPIIRSGSGWSYGAGSRSQVLIDGAPILSGDAGQPLWTFVPLEESMGIEILKGASSVTYGSSGLNGVINVSTRPKNWNKKTYVSQTFGFYQPKERSSEYWSNDEHGVNNFSIYHQGKNDKIKYKFSSFGLLDDGFREGDFDQRLRLGAGIERNVKGNKDSYYGVNSSFQFGNSGSFLLWDSYKNNYNILNGDLTKTKSIRLRLDPYISISNQDKGLTHKVIGRWLKVKNEVENEEANSNQSNESDFMYLDYQVTKKFKSRTQIITGLTTSFSQTNSPLFGGKQQMNNEAIFVQTKKSWDNVRILAGLRLERYQLNQNSIFKPIGLLGLNANLSKHTFFRATWGQGFRYPSMAESFISTNVGPVTIFPNPDLKPETGWNAEIGIKQGWTLGGVTGYADLALFMMKFQDYIEFTFAQWADPLTSSNFGIGFKSINTGDAQVLGADLATYFKGKANTVEISGYIGYTQTLPQSKSPLLAVETDFSGNPMTYTSTSSNSNGAILKYRSRHLLKAEMDFNFKNGFFCGVSGRHVGAMENIDTAFVSFPISLSVPGIDSAMSKNLTRYNRFDFRVGHRFSELVEMSLIINNVFDVAYMTRPALMGRPRTISLRIGLNL